MLKSGGFLSPQRRFRQRGFSTVRANFANKGVNMLWTLFVILLILWLLGLISGYTLGGVIHILLVIAIIVIVLQVIQGRRRL